MRTIAIPTTREASVRPPPPSTWQACTQARGSRVLLIDLDPQASASDYYGLYERAKTEGRTTIELLYEGASVGDIAYPWTSPACRLSHP